MSLLMRVLMEVVICLKISAGKTKYHLGSPDDHIFNEGADVATAKLCILHQSVFVVMKYHK